MPCEACSGEGVERWAGPEHEFAEREAGPCAACHGDGTALGAYVAAQLEAEDYQRRLEEVFRLSQRGTEADLRAQLELVLGVSELEIDHDREAKTVTVRCRCEYAADERAVRDALDRSVPAGILARLDVVLLPKLEPITVTGTLAL